MSIRVLHEHYRRVWREDVSFEEEKELIAALLEHHDREHLAFHFELLRNREHFYVYCSIRAAFKKHGPQAESFLVERFQTETDPHLRGDALQILGNMRSKSARALAKEAAMADEETLRYRGVIVLAPNGDYVMDFNSAGMFRGVKQEGGEAKVAIYGE